MEKAGDPPLRDGIYRALVGERAFELVFRGGTLEVDGEPVAYRFEAVSGGLFALLVEGRSLSVVVEPAGAGRLRVTLEGRQVEVRVQDEQDLLLERFGMAEEAGAGLREVHAPMPGLVLDVFVEPGQAVQAGDGLLVLEAMKMENELRAEMDGTVRAVHVKSGDAVGKNELLLEFE